jgi:hypothetical protein
MSTDDLVALTWLQSRYADVISRRAFGELDMLFLPTTTVEVDTVTHDVRRFTGPEPFGAFVETAIARFDHFVFAVLNATVDLDGADSARGRTFMCEIRHEHASGEWSYAYGLYQDTFTRVDGRWWFATRRYRSMARTGPDAAVFGLPPIER